MKAHIRRQLFEVYVCDDDGTHLNEYKEEVEESRTSDSCPTTSCYLECTEGQNFSVVARVDEGVKRDCDWVIAVSINGRLIRELIMDRKDSEVWCSSMVHQEHGRLLDSALRFTKLATSDKPDAVSVSIARMQELGQIKVECRAGKMGAKSGKRDEHVTKRIEPEVADEIKAKRLTGTVGIGASKAHMPAVTYHFTPYDKRRPTYRFVFHYRTEAVLRLMTIIGGGDGGDGGTIELDDTDDERLAPIAAKRKRGLSDSPPPRKSRDADMDPRDREIASLRRQIGGMTNEMREMKKAISNGPGKTVIDLTFDSDDEA